MKKNQKITTWNWLDLATLGIGPIMPKISPDTNILIKNSTFDFFFACIMEVRHIFVHWIPPCHFMMRFIQNNLIYLNYMSLLSA